MPRKRKRKAAPKRRAIKSPLLAAVIALAATEEYGERGRQVARLRREMLKRLPGNLGKASWLADQQKLQVEEPRRHLARTTAPEIYPYI